MSLIVSITKTLLFYFLLQSAAFLCVFRLWMFPFNYVLLFFTFQFVFYCIIFLFLIKNKNLFYKTANGEKETSLNSANKITLLRITMLPFLILLTLVSQKYVKHTSLADNFLLTGAFALTFATDFIDGQLVRIKKNETYIGKILDSTSDYLLLGITAGAFYYFELLPPWLFLIIIIRLFLNALVMLILFLVQKKLSPQTTFLGKTAIAVIMVLLVLKAANMTAYLRWIHWAEDAAAVLIGISIIDKIIYLIKGLKQSLPEHS